MEELTNFLHHNLAVVCELMALLVEVWGTFLLAMVLIKEIRNNIKKKFDFTHILNDARLNHGLSTVLEFYLASEILKTVYAENIKSLTNIGLLVVLRISMSVALHWESKHKHTSIDVKHYVDIDDRDVQEMAEYFKGGNNIMDKIRDKVVSVVKDREEKAAQEYGVNDSHEE